MRLAGLVGAGVVLACLAAPSSARAQSTLTEEARRAIVRTLEGLFVATQETHVP